MMAAERSKSLPFLLKPAKVIYATSTTKETFITISLTPLLQLLVSIPQLDGSLAGDEGFDPLGLSNIEELGIGKKIISQLLPLS